MDSMEVSKGSSSSTSSKEGIKVVRGGIKLVLMVVLLGSLIIWIMSPTNTFWQNWWAKIRAEANSTYFGPQGVIILIYTFPILFVAALGCVYLHLGTKLNHNIVESGKTNRLAVWKRPVLVKGPLGIISGIELAFFTMFIALLIWSFSTYLHVSFAKITAKSLEKGEKMWEAKLESAGQMLGLVGNIGLAFLFFPVTRFSSILPIFGLTTEGSIKYHIWLGHIVMVLFTAHGLVYIIYWAATHELHEEILQWSKTGISNVAGELALLAGLVMWGTTIPRIRRRFFELFFYTHYLYILFMFFFILHVGIPCACIILPGFYLFLIDRYLRLLQSRQKVRLVSARVLPCETLELNFSKSSGLSYTPTSIMFVNVPSISRMQWHPFTISSSSNLEQERLSVMIKSEGSWSRKLYQLLSSPSIEHLDVSIEGPYGPASTHFLRHDTLVMVSGGSGITPFISIIRDLIFRDSALKCKTPKIILICAFKNSSELTTLDLLLPISGTPSGLSNLDIQIQAYVTREKAPTTTTTTKNQNLRTIWFKPNVSDAAISPILGQRFLWLWLAAIISSSFIMFLLLLGIMTRYYIYPIDHNTYMIYPTSSRALLSMLLICGCTVMTASAAVLWNKKDSAKEAKQIQNMEGLTPMTSPNSWLYNADRELESIPQQSLVQATKVHFGERPDLKKMLFECKGSSVGVLVCGPKKMRHEVANICSSGLAENLHFESISFSW